MAQPNESTHVVVLIHGIRDFALWQNDVRVALEQEGFIVEPTNYERFDVLRFLIPLPYFRRRIAEKLQQQIEQVYARHPGKTVSFIAHSFGTFILGEILSSKRDFKACRIILCGSVLPYDFPFDAYASHFTAPVLNEVGTDDIWPALAQSVTVGYGSAGSYGFRRPYVRDRWHEGLRHGDFLASAFSKKYWVPFLTDGTIVPGATTPSPPALWVKLLYIFKLKYIAIAALILVALFAPPNLWRTSAAERWIEVARKARQEGTIHSSRPLPADLIEARTKFENWWRNSGLAQRRQLQTDTAFEALSLVSRLYRLHEQADELKPNSSYWNEQCLEFFEQIQARAQLTECLIDRAALYLELSQIQHTQPEKFKRVSEDGDRVMIRATSLASDKQKPESLRIASRFYYNLARPNNGVLSMEWSNNYLILAIEKAQEAQNLAPRDIKNTTQLTRSTQRLAANPPQLNDPLWTSRLQAASELMWQAFERERDKLRSPTSYIPPANIVAVSTMDVARRMWREAKDQQRQSSAATVLSLLRERALPTQLRAWATIKDTEWAKDYGFDMSYDLGRIRLVLVKVLDELGDPSSDGEFRQAIDDMRAAAAVATAIQFRASRMAVDTEPTFSGLRIDRRKALQEVFEIR